MKLKLNIVAILIGLVILLSLINWGVFGSVTTASLFFFSFGVFSFSIITTGRIIKNTEPIEIGNPLPVYLFLGLVIYYILNSVIIQNQSIGIKHFLLLTYFIFLVTVSILISQGDLKVTAIFKIIIIIAVLESVLCILQLTGVIKSLNDYFKVTGSWENPNVTAMFIGLSIPIIVGYIVRFPKKYYSFLILLTLIIALISLKCRTAIIGSVVASFIVINTYYRISQRIIKEYKGLKLLAVLVGCTVIITIAALYAYHVKQASADGRILVWKVSLKMIARNPLFGTGLGKFEHDYNLEQAHYFELNKYTENEAINASYVRMAYNEFLQNTVEGGIVGFVIFSALILSLLPFPSLTKGKDSELDEQKKNDYIILTISYASIISFVCMSVLNFTIEAIPAMCLFIIYMAVVIVNKETKKSIVFNRPSQIIITSNIKRAVFSCIAIIAVFVFLIELKSSKNIVENKEAITLVEDKKYSDALIAFSDIDYKLKGNVTFLENYAKALYATKNVKAALEKLRSASDLTSDPSVYISIGKCCVVLKQFDEAEKAFFIAKNIEPSHLTAYYELAKLYIQKNDMQMLRIVANKLITIKPKVVSKQTLFYQEQARQFLQNINSINIPIKPKTVS